MKKILLMLPIVASCFMSAQKIEVAISYGAPSLYGTTDSILQGIGSAAGAAISGGEVRYPDSNGVLNISLAMYNSDMKWRYGLEANLESFNQNNSNLKNQSYISILPKVDYFWSGSDKKFRFYSGVSVGVLFKNSEYQILKEINKDNGTSFAFNIMPIGVRYGGDFGVFLESNIGTRGFAQAGVSYIF